MKYKFTTHGNNKGNDVQEFFSVALGMGAIVLMAYLAMSFAAPIYNILSIVLGGK